MPPSAPAAQQSQNAEFKFPLTSHRARVRRRDARDSGHTKPPAATFKLLVTYSASSSVSASESVRVFAARSQARLPGDTRVAQDRCMHALECMSFRDRASVAGRSDSHAAYHLLLAYWDADVRRTSTTRVTKLISPSPHSDDSAYVPVPTPVPFSIPRIGTLTLSNARAGVPTIQHQDQNGWP